MSEMQIIPWTKDILSVERNFPDEPGVRSMLLLGERYTVVFDTMYSPTDMLEAAAIAHERGRPILVVDTHADGDHALGNAAFPGVPIIAHELTRQRLATSGDRLAAYKAARPLEFATSSLVLPTITFDKELWIDLGGMRLHLVFLPGHRIDTIVGHIPERQLLLAADCAEDPIPILGSGPIAPWAAALRGWAADPGVATVIPAHGPITDRRLLLANAAYLEGLDAGRLDGWQPGPDALPFYSIHHAKNVEKAQELRAAGGSA